MAKAIKDIEKEVEKIIKIMIKRISSIIVILIVFSTFFVIARAATDSDIDGLSDEIETTIYYTNPNQADTDADGYPDQAEILSGYSPHRPKYRLSQLDWDKDGLSDELELKFGTDLKNPDSDADGHIDGDEVKNGYNPLSRDTVKLPKKIEVNLAKQELSYFLGQVSLATFKISSGKPGWLTPQGNFKIYEKNVKRWSNAAGLWMPYWLGFRATGAFGIHELPIWPSGLREGADHLGKPISHGCIRLGIGPAQILYNFAEVGTPVIIK